MKNNTVVTAGDRNYLWGLFLLIASMRKTGMDEPVVVGAYDFTPEAEAILTQLGDVTIYPLSGYSCRKRNQRSTPSRGRSHLHARRANCK